MQTADHAKTSDFEDYAAWVGESMAVGPIDLNALAGSAQPLLTLPADNPAFLLGRNRIGVRFAGGLP